MLIVDLVQVPPILVQKIFTQIFSYINVQLFNSLLLRRECCTFSNGEYVKAGLAELELWCCQAKEEYAGLSWDELKHIRQAVGFLVLDLSFNDFKGPGFEPLENCKALQQLYLAGNQITSLLSLPQLPNLEVLAASKNKISTLKGFPHFPVLEVSFLDMRLK
ncbi:hypothetical protein HHK36_023283 [Tetracentron sinense]|uniref:Dilute domain-containing protein n=1 Tax=Tetracentron sinense TaxID=13715 RepID=A0A834YQZ1_TETSI|nr:hypothetical protein HHK36_023283 [Tetracentron sinense]